MLTMQSAHRSILGDIKKERFPDDQLKVIRVTATPPYDYSMRIIKERFFIQYALQLSKKKKPLSTVQCDVNRFVLKTTQSCMATRLLEVPRDLRLVHKGKDYISELHAVTP